MSRSERRWRHSAAAPPPAGPPARAPPPRPPPPPPPPLLAHRRHRGLGVGVLEPLAPLRCHPWIVDLGAANRYGPRGPYLVTSARAHRPARSHRCWPRASPARTNPARRATASDRALSSSI